MTGLTQTVGSFFNCARPGGFPYISCHAVPVVYVNSLGDATGDLGVIIALSRSMLEENEEETGL